MNTALLRTCHVFMQLSYILATCTRCSQASSSRGHPTWSCSWNKHWPAVFQESLFIVYHMTFYLDVLSCRWKHRLSRKRLKPTLNTLPFPFAIWTLFRIRELIQKENEDKLYVAMLLITLLSAWWASKSYVPLFATTFPSWPFERRACSPGNYV